MSKGTTFANIRVAHRFLKITYYSVSLNEEPTLFTNFLKEHTDAKYSKDIAVIRKFISKLGNEIGANARYFRDESFRGGCAKALPPPSFYLKGEKKCNLRLYCMHVNERVVILFGGATKTAATAQECPLVSPHFKQANRLSKIIQQEINDGMIQFTKTGDIDMTDTTTFNI